MIIDSLNVFFDDEPTAASMTGETVSFQPYAGREDPIYISAQASATNTAEASYAFTVQESDDESAWSDIGTFTMEKPDALPVLRSFRLPCATRKPFVRLTCAVTGASDGTVFAAVTRDHMAGYAEGLYIDSGKVVA